MASSDLFVQATQRRHKRKRQAVPLLAGVTRFLVLLPSCCGSSNSDTEQASRKHQALVAKWHNSVESCHQLAADPPENEPGDQANCANVGLKAEELGQVTSRTIGRFHSDPLSHSCKVVRRLKSDSSAQVVESLLRSPRLNQSRFFQPLAHANRLMRLAALFVVLQPIDDPLRKGLPF
jgi:hypothetical protein